MAAGLGFKTFTTGEVLTAGDVNGYLMQGVLVFASAAARDSAITSPQEGQFAYLKDTNVTTYYTGSAWTNLDTTGMVNPMTTTGDTIYSSSGSTPARLGIGSTGQVLTVAGGVPTWATPAAGGMTLLSTTTLSGASTTISTISQSYKQLFGYFIDVYGSNADVAFWVRYNSDTGSNYMLGRAQPDTNPSGFVAQDKHFIGALTNSSTSTRKAWGWIQLINYTSTGTKIGMASNAYDSVLYAYEGNIINNLAYFGGSAITSITLLPSAGTFTDGTFLLYGVN
jgi:hypothetical protein